MKTPVHRAVGRHVDDIYRICHSSPTTSAITAVLGLYRKLYPLAKPKIALAYSPPPAEPGKVLAVRLAITDCRPLTKAELAPEYRVAQVYDGTPAGLDAALLTVADQLLNALVYTASIQIQVNLGTPTQPRMVPLYEAVREDITVRDAMTQAGLEPAPVAGNLTGEDLPIGNPGDACPDTTG